MKRLAWIASLVLLTACADAQRDRETALLRDAKACEADADSQLQNAGAAKDTNAELLVSLDKQRAAMQRPKPVVEDLFIVCHREIRQLHQQASCHSE